ncbi:thermosome subunit [Halobaculum sp. CBA1158]|uniref:thermosome subunit alpha n=1 Tax=Halobaculum sp. CBA1158 TaxID=2904243 RepID=UPI001F2B5DE7|nr:thermosome subunit alpha [Halobaculum sp. CBA1158]UIP01241.1 thermosome subunit [Halobaculum sp. CBA1158]
MQQPLYVLSESSQRTSGLDARRSNAAAGRAVASAVRTTLGPRGMDKMLVDTAGDVVVTNDGATILGEMDIEHPAARMLVEVAESQESAVGDGTTTAAVLAGELLARAEDLLDDDVHATAVVEGYHEAMRLALDAVDGMVLDGAVDRDALVRLARSAMTGKGTGDLATDALAEIVADAVLQVADDDRRVDRDDIRVFARTGASAAATELVRGVVFEGEPATDTMPRGVEDAAVAVLDTTLDVRSGEVDTEYTITSADQLDAALSAEDAERRAIAETLAEAGVDVVFCSKKVSDPVAAYLADAGVLAFSNVTAAEARAVARATGARRLGTLDGIEADDLGAAASVRVERHGDDDVTFLEGTDDSRTVTLYVRGSTDHVVDETERAIDDALGVVVAAHEDGEVVPGAGAVEVAVADRLRSGASAVTGRKSLAVEAFADAVDAIPRTLAENAGLDPIDALVDLRARHEREGVAGVVIDGPSVDVADPADGDVVDPAAVKREALESATEAATMILRIDDVIAAN